MTTESAAPSQSQSQSPSPSPSPTPTLNPIDVRRAVLSTFFRAGGGPLTIDQVVDRTRDDAGLDLATLGGVNPRQRVSDILRHQVRAGRAEVVARGAYRVFMDRFSESTRRRCLQWQKAADHRRRYPAWVSLSRTVP